MKTEKYESPEIEVIEVEIEQGFASSDIGGHGDGMKPASLYDDWE